MYLHASTLNIVMKIMLLQFFCILLIMESNVFFPPSEKEIRKEKSFNSQLQACALTIDTIIFMYDLVNNNLPHYLIDY